MRLSLTQLEHAFEIEPGKRDLALAAKHKAVGFVLFFAARDGGIDARDALRMLIKQPAALIEILEMLTDADTDDVREVISGHHPVAIEEAPSLMILMSWASMQMMSKIALTRKL